MRCYFICKSFMMVMFIIIRKNKLYKPRNTSELYHPYKYFGFYFIYIFQYILESQEKEGEREASEREGGGEMENKRLGYARDYLSCRLETIWLITMRKAAKITLARLAHCSGMIDGFPLNMQQRADGKRNFSELSNA
ncbi:hypothetical protein T08_15689 [Trichinella sp. T8]|nr:hypothetical protein T08_15689 [Trichinella sp. T8]